MEIVVKVERILDAQSFTKKDGTQVVRNTFIGVTGGQYPKHIAFEVVNADVWQKMGIRIGSSYNVSFDVSSREWQGRWYTSCGAWKVVCVDGGQVPQQQAQTQAPVQAPQAQPQVAQPADLPF